jgi:DNA-binding transcriptional ArsR family regulator
MDKAPDVPLKEYLAARETHIRAKIAELRSELKEVLAAREAISPSVESDSEPKRLTIKQMAADTLHDIEDGDTAEGLIRRIRDRYGVDIPRTSLSPQLSRLKDDNVVLVDEATKKWRHTRFVSVNGASVSESGGSAPSL